MGEIAPYCDIPTCLPQYVHMLAMVAAYSVSAPVCSPQANVQYNGTRLSVMRGGTFADCCSQCSKDGTCAVFNFHPVGTLGQPTFCELQAAGGAAVPTHPVSNFLAGVPSAHVFCEDDEGCSLAGSCQPDGTCLCDGWSHGDHCEVLNLLDVDAVAFGYRNSSGYNSWGGASVAFGGKHLLFASQMGGRCPLLGYWDRVSEGVRLVGDKPNGPFDLVDEIVLPSFAHNVKPFQAPDGTWLLFYIGSINSDTTVCNSSTTEESASASPPIPHETAGPVMLASASRPDAPSAEWTLHGPLTDSVGWHSATNPSALFYPNGTVLLAVSRATDPGGKRTTLMSADSWRGPYRNLTHGYNESIGNGEDPDLFRTKRGFHMLNHNTGPGSTRIWFSRDGLSRWRVADGHANAFNATVRFTNGSEMVLCQRQRPQIVMAADGMPGWLWTGVMGGSPCPKDDRHGALNPTWTLAQQIGRNSEKSKGGGLRPGTT